VVKLRKALQYPWWFLIPALALYLTLYVYPVLSGFYYSFTDWNVYREQISFVGLEQYRSLLASNDLVTAFGHTLIYAFVVTVFQNGLGFLLALVLNARLKGRNLLRMIYFFPCTLSALVVGFMFSAILHPDGMVNQFLGALNMPFLKQEWLGDGNINLYVLAFINVWQWAGFSMAIYLAGLQNVPKEMTEAARIDGCSYFQSIRKVIFPLIAPAFTVNVIMTLIGSLKTFELVYVITGGGPGTATEVANTLIFKQFSQGQYAYGTAVSVCLFLFIAAVSFPILHKLRQREVEA